MRKRLRQRGVCRLQSSHPPRMLWLLSTTCCLRKSQFIFPEGWTTCDIWQWSIRRFHPAVPGTHTHTVAHRGGGRGWRSHRRSFDRLSRLTYNCYISMCNDHLWCGASVREHMKIHTHKRQNCLCSNINSVSILQINTSIVALLCDITFG